MLELLSGTLHALSDHAAIDLGSSRTRIYLKGRGIVLDEPSAAAFDQIDEKRGDFITAGREAVALAARSPGVALVHPIRNGVVADFAAADEMFRHFLQSAPDRRGFISPHILLCLPTDATAVERRATGEIGESAGARRIALIDAPLAAAAGAGLSVAEPLGSLVVNVGAGVTDVAVIASGRIAQSHAIRVGSAGMDESILRFLRRTRDLAIDLEAAERLKIEFGSACYPARGHGRILAVCGHNASTGAAMTTEITERELTECFVFGITAIVEATKAVLERMSPELSSDTVERGIVLTGGGAQLADLDVALRQATGLAVSVAEQPDECVVRGAGRLLEEGAAFGRRPVEAIRPARRDD